MKSSEINHYRDYFTKYTNSFLGTDQYKNKNYILKQDHTKRVCKNILDICKSLNFSESEKNIAETIALYHDIGRFEQFKEYNTFSDKISENHALLGIKILKKNKVLDHSKYKKIILSAIRFHNIKTIPEQKIDKNTILYSKLLRDADKLDILSVLTNYYTNNRDDNPALDLDLPETQVYTKNVLDQFLSNKCVDTKSLKSSLDFKILQLSWIYDINFKYTISKINREGYLNKIISVLPVNMETKKINNHINKSFGYNC